MKKTDEKGSWILAGILLLAGVFCADVLWSAPSPILGEIMSDLSLSLAMGGMIMSVIMLIYSAATFGTALLERRIPAKYLFFAGLVFLSAGQLLFVFASGLTEVLIFRAMTGIGMGILAPVYAILVMDNIPESKRPLINTLYAGLPYAAMFISVYSIVFAYQLSDGSWRKALSLLGLPVSLTAMLFLRFLRSMNSAKKSDGERKRGMLAEVSHMREVRLLLLADSCDMWGYTFLSSFLPTFLREEAGMTMTQASTATSVFPIMGVVGCIAGGVLMIRVGLRKPFTWPMHLMIFAGTLITVLSSGPLRILGIALAGFGNAAWAPALYTMPMEFDGIDAEKAGAIFSFVFGIGYIAGFLSALAGGWIGDHFGLRTAFIINSLFAVIAAAATLSMKETGKRKKRTAP